MQNQVDFEKIYRSHIKLVRKIISTHNITNGTADDIAQQTFLKVFEKLDSLKDTSVLHSWIAVIARNSCLSHYRGQRFVALDLDSPNSTESNAEFQLGLWIDPETNEFDIEIEENLRLMNYLLTKYSKEPRGSIARKFYLEGLSTKEIAENFDLPQNTVLSHLMLFRREMKSALLRLQERNQKSQIPKRFGN